MIDRRSFTALLAGAFATPRTAWSQITTSKAVFYASVGPALTLYQINVDETKAAFLEILRATHDPARL